MIALHPDEDDGGTRVLSAQFLHFRCRNLFFCRGACGLDVRRRDPVSEAAQKSAALVAQLTGPKHVIYEEKAENATRTP
jgi:hypothetical protein